MPAPLSPQVTPLETPQPELQKPKFRHSPWAVFLGFLVLGPLVVPMVWKNPYWSKQVKIWVTLVMVGVTVFFVWEMIHQTQALLDSVSTGNL